MRCSVCTHEVPALKPELEDIRIIAASPRIDDVVASIAKLSRSSSGELFSSKKIYVNGQCIENKSAYLKPDIFFIYVAKENSYMLGMKVKQEKEEHIFTLKICIGILYRHL